MDSGIFLLLGTNLGDREQNLAKAKDLISKQVGNLVKESSIYQTAAWGKNDQPDFYNEVIEIDTTLSPQALLQTTLHIEEELGRKRMETWGPRVIDIDILLYRDSIIDTARLTIPHPAMAQRRFTLVPLAEIAADILHPVLQKKISELLDLCPDQLAVRRR
ncbi:MAG TPA: 2-amino-4-hydroxy-6-hydroxymethyldihydropteridine diphosphokinase [Ohtaekwangia sp.]|uniref:2-amino-4-hydroxy-6- hydroxymethyldihydropteridine diphosphokinase n=1 Tax=Ohtaekwangia sp. TaxID=2066019 RepID=UPI002F94F7F8